MLDEIAYRINKKFNTKINFNHYSGLQITIVERGLLLMQ
jgi:hypothetical protein